MTEKVNDVCSNCVVWKSQGSKCWYHWEEKQVCTQKIELDMPDSKPIDNVSKYLDEKEQKETEIK